VVIGKRDCILLQSNFPSTKKTALSLLCTLRNIVECQLATDVLVYQSLFLSHWLMCLFLCQYHAVLTNTDLQDILKSGTVSPALFFLLKMVFYLFKFFAIPHRF
jgi:hypothetical protein